MIARDVSEFFLNITESPPFGLFPTHSFYTSNRVAKGQALEMGLKLMAISRKKVFFPTLINEIDSTLPEMQVLLSHLCWYPNFFRNLHLIGFFYIGSNLTPAPFTPSHLSAFGTISNSDYFQGTLLEQVTL